MVVANPVSALSLAGLSLVAGALARLDKPLIKPEIPSLDAGLFKNLKPTQSTHDQWEWGCTSFSQERTPRILLTK